MRARRVLVVLAGVFAAVLLFVITVARPSALADSCPAQTYDEFGDPERVTIQGYDDHAMEPFITRDGAYLLFNNSNDPSVNTDLHYASRVDETTFEYIGKIEGVNTESLEGVATMGSEGDFYFVSTRSYETTSSVIYRGRFSDGVVSDVALVAGISREEAGIVNFDVEVSPDGNTLYFVDSQFNSTGTPQSADLVIAVTVDGTFERASNNAQIFENVNSSDAWEYAAAISADGLELFFTRYEPQIGNIPTIYRAARQSLDKPFACPEQVSAIEGFVEGPTFSPDEQSLYYHLQEDGDFVIYRVTR
jgi:hypothetical protein